MTPSVAPSHRAERYLPSALLCPIRRPTPASSSTPRCGTTRRTFSSATSSSPQTRSGTRRAADRSTRTASRPLRPSRGVASSRTTQAGSEGAGEQPREDGAPFALPPPPRRPVHLDAVARDDGRVRPRVHRHDPRDGVPPAVVRAAPVRGHPAVALPVPRRPRACCAELPRQRRLHRLVPRPRAGARVCARQGQGALDAACLLPSHDHRTSTIATRLAATPTATAGSSITSPPPASPHSSPRRQASPSGTTRRWRRGQI